MNAVPSLSVIVILPQSANEVSDLLWSMRRERDLAFEVVLVLDQDRRPDIANVVHTAATEDSRVRAIGVDSERGRNFALAAGLDASKARWVTVADSNGLAAAGGYAALMGSVQSTESQMGVGVAESIARARTRVTRVAENALDTAAQGISLQDRPALITDDLLCTKVVDLKLLRSLVEEEEPWHEELLVARLYASAKSIDVLPRSIVFCNVRISESTTVPMSKDWVADQLKIWEALSNTSREVREAFARQIIERHVLCGKALQLLASQADRHDAANFIRDLVADLSSTALANVPVRPRWQLALIALGYSSLVDTPLEQPRRMRPSDVPDFDMSRLQAPAWSSLGLRENETPRAAFIDRFVSHPAIAPRTQHDTSTIDISIVIPTFNVEAYIDELLESIRASVGVSLEVIVVDDGSTDGTWERVVAHTAEDSRVRLIRSPGAGGGQARDAGIELARGEYLAFADGDDLIPPRAYYRMLSIARRSNADIVNGSYLKFFAISTWDASTGFNHAYALPLENVSIQTHPQLARHRAVWNRLIRREHWLGTAFPFPGVPRSNDIVAMMSVLLSATTVAVTPVQTYIYRDRPGSGSMTSAAGSVDYTVSYFLEESTCASLVQQSGFRSVEREYWSMVFTQDSWKNILKYLDRRTGDRAEDSRVSEQIKALLSQAPHAEFSQIKPEHQAVWALAAEGKFSEARTMAHAEKSAHSMPPESLIHAIRSAEESALLPPAAANTLVLKYLGRRFISDAAWRNEVFASALPIIRRRLLDPVMPLVFVPHSWEERLGHAILAGDLAVVLAAFSPEKTSINARLHQGAPAKLVGPAPGLSPEGGVRIMARRHRSNDRARIPVGHATRVDGRWSAELSVAAFPSTGVWAIELEYEDAYGMRRSHLRIDGNEERFGLSVFRRVVTAHAGKNHSLIRVREPLPIRARQKAYKLLRITPRK
ncbi:glycosyltransferase family 2 protein [Microbacterium sp. NC79]|uniref:glycosyltransferase family 2 protein n=1 Tax=Microbacterium sp. NC79 TaxID=2851009 RepID=UPI001C2BBC29|nr:glycosyltransferase family 2 protein [Microbacterium sp. NC79]MBV0894072.1 glycosyltransferase [Microbacterium sp. NC79]